MSELAKLEEAVDEVRKDVKSILQQQATTAAKLDASSAQAQAQIAVLFEKRDNDGERLRRVELDYVPRGEHERLERENQKDHEQVMARLGALEKRIAGWMAIIGLVMFLLQLVGAVLLKRVLG